MNIRPLLAAGVLLAGVPLAASSLEGTEPAAGFRLVVHQDNPIRALPASDVSKIFLKKLSRWPEGGRVEPVDQGPSAPVREAFTEAVMRRSVASIQSYWERQIFAGVATPPPQLASDAEVLRYVAANPAAIGYVASDGELPPEVRYLDLGELDAASRGRDLVAEHREPPPQTIVHDLGQEHPRDHAVRDQRQERHREPTVDEQRGEIYLLRTASCGDRGAGRRVVLQNRSRERRIDVEVERSIWADGAARSSSSRGYALDPGEEVELGCSHVGAGVEERFEIGEVSDISKDPVRVQVVPPAGGPVTDVDLVPPEVSAREAVRLVEADTCGRDGEGRWIVAGNAHGARAVKISVQHVQKVEGKVRRIFQKSHVLSPGAEKRLACTADGAHGEEVSLASAEYR